MKNRRNVSRKKEASRTLRKQQELHYKIVDDTAKDFSILNIIDEAIGIEEGNRQRPDVTYCMKKCNKILIRNETRVVSLEWLL